jgi:hypothetical protein
MPIRREKRKRGQATFDYLLLAGLIIVAAIPIFGWATKTFSVTSHYEKAQETVDITVGLLNTVNRYGEGYEKCVKATIPEFAESFFIINGYVTMNMFREGENTEIIGQSRADGYGEVEAGKRKTQICASKPRALEGAILVTEKGATCEKDGKCLAICDKDLDCRGKVL